MSIPAASHTRSPVELETKSAKALTEAVTSLPKTLNSTANDMVKAALDPDLTRYAQLGKTFRNGTAAVKNQLQQLRQGRIWSATRRTERSIRPRYRRHDAVLWERNRVG